MVFEDGDCIGGDKAKQQTLVFGASVIGPLHVQMNLPCQDACGYRVLPMGDVLVAVADGLGSASKSEIGARLAVTAAMDSAAILLNDGTGLARDEVMRQAVGSARQQLEDHAASTGCQLRDLACTLILALMENNRVVVAHIGDGAVVADLGESFQVVSDPGDSEFVNEVVPLTSSDWREELRIVSVNSGIQGIAVFTDGCQRAAFRKSEAALMPFEGFFRPIFCFARETSDTVVAVQEIEALLACNKICNNSDDDKTLVLAVNNSG